MLPAIRRPTLAKDDKDQHGWRTRGDFFGEHKGEKSGQDRLDGPGGVPEGRKPVRWVSLDCAERRTTDQEPMRIDLGELGRRDEQR